MIPTTGDRSAHDFYGPRLLRHRVTGNRLTRKMRARHGRRIGCRTSREYTNRRERRSQVASHLPSKTWLAGQATNLHALNKRTWRLVPDDASAFSDATPG